MALAPPIDRAALDAMLREHGLNGDTLRHSHPHLFAGAFVRVDAAQIEDMARLIAAIEAVVALPAYQEAALAWGPESARDDPGYPGLCMGYDFHLTPEGARLIEINTNAGGGLLNARLAESQQARCAALAESLGDAPRRYDHGAADILALFLSTWRAFRGERPLRRIAIVDTEPARQYLAPEFALFRRLFVAAGIDACIADPAELVWDGKTLRHASGPVDLVYNRLTDFALAAPAHQMLRDAYRTGGVLLTPHPHAHALYADKRNLTLLSSPEWLRRAGVAAPHRAILQAGIPRTVLVCADTPEAIETLWKARKAWFFKPATGFGSRAVYRGDKLTRRVFAEEILSGHYIAQTLTPPSTQNLEQGGEIHPLKLDVRCYADQGRIHLFAARLYQGQTTNFRTPGGGFAPVLPMAASMP
ncbi:MAG: hypothetical protein LBS89_07360 [Zoogloeaceae bacterium]|jgi:hypothetical protein|nr:hypothetical protein [Zoogloeaceae bacterium]